MGCLSRCRTSVRCLDHLLPHLDAFLLTISVGSGYLFPAKDGPVYVLGSAICVGLSVFSSVVAGIYQFLIWRENKRRDAEEGGPPALGFRPDVQTYADEAPGYRYIG